jgi:hypothetical protein
MKGFENVCIESVGKKYKKAYIKGSKPKSKSNKC